LRTDSIVLPPAQQFCNPRSIYTTAAEGIKAGPQSMAS
jgi:hypothetical protein